MKSLRRVAFVAGGLAILGLSGCVYPPPPPPPPRPPVARRYPPPPPPVVFVPPAPIVVTPAPPPPPAPVVESRIFPRPLGVVESAVIASGVAPGVQPAPFDQGHGVSFYLAGGGVIEVRDLPQGQTKVMVSGLDPARTQAILNQIGANVR